MNPFILFLLGISGFLFKFLFNGFLARHLSSGLYGDFSVALSVFNVVSAYMLFGTATSSFRFFSNYLKKNQPEVASHYLAWNLRIVLISSLIFLFLLSLFTTVIVGFHFFHIHDIREYHLVVYFLWLTPIGALTLLFTTYLLCNRHIYLGTFFSTVSFYFFGFLLLIPAVYLIENRLHSELLWLLMLCIIVINALFQSFILFFRMRNLFINGVSQVFSQTANDKILEQEWWGVSIRLIFNQLIYLIVSTLDLVLLEIIDPSKAIVGHYAAALTIAGIILVTQQSIFQFVSPQISSLTEKKEDRPQLQKLIHKAQMANLLLNTSLIILIIIFMYPLLLFFGPEYLVSEKPLLILLAADFISLFATPGTKLLAYSGNEDALLPISFAQIATVLVLGIILIYYLSAVGAALAVLGTVLVKAILSVYFVKRRLRIKTAIVF